jgi:Protein of unknown function (DUF2637)
MSQHATGTGRQSRGDVWVRRGCALVVAAVAAYSSYAHQRHFALVGGADQVSAALWPLSVDGLVVLASLGLVRARSSTTTRAQLALWVAFLLGVAVSLATCACVTNIAPGPGVTYWCHFTCSPARLTRPWAPTPSRSGAPWQAMTFVTTAAGRPLLHPEGLVPSPGAHMVQL